jgi:O-antigen/teichoic acid export membrane protein
VREIVQAVWAARENAFYRHNALFWAASLGVSTLNYLYYPVLGRLLDPTSFGETQTIISFFTQAGAFFQVLGLVSIGIITKYSDERERERLTNEISRLALILSLVFFGLSLVFSPLLEQFFHFTSVGPFVLLGISLLVNVPLSFANAYLQGHKRFKTLASVNILGAISKLSLSVCFVLLGLQTMGAIGGLICAQLIGLLYSLRRGTGLRHFVRNNLQLRRINLELLRLELPYGAMVLATSLTTNLLLSFDILVVKHYFTPVLAGLYTGISITSNIIYYITGPFAAVMIPSIKPAHSAAQNYRTLQRSLLITGSIGGSVLLIFLLVPHLVIVLLLGHKYARYAIYLRGLGLSMFTLSLANLLIYYHIGLRHFLVAPAVLVGLATTLVLLATAHATIGLVVRDLIIGAFVLLALLAGLLPIYRERTV